MLRWVEGVCLLSVIWLAGCGESLATREELREIARTAIEANKDRIQERLALYQEIARAALEVPKEDLPPPDLAGRPKLMPAYLVDDPVDGLEDPTSPLYGEIPLQSLLNPRADRETSRAWLSLSLGSWFTYPFGIIDGEWENSFRQGTKSLAQSYFNDFFAGFFGPRYLLVVRTHNLEEGVLLEDDAEPEDYFGRKIVGQYVSGRFVGDVLLYDLQDRTFLGIPIDVENSSQIDKSKLDRDPDYFRSDLRRNARYRLDEAMKPIMGR